MVARITESCVKPRNRFTSSWSLISCFHEGTSYLNTLRSSDRKEICNNSQRVGGVFVVETELLVKLISLLG